jgi:chromosome segregation ATPase
MGIYGGSPPPPPDYTAQKAAIRKQTEEQYAKQAGDWNKAVEDYNTTLSGYGTTYGDLSRQIGGLNIGSFYDDPSTTVNENPYESLRNSLNKTRTGLSGLSLNIEKPNFSSTINSEYGPITISNIPTLKAVQTGKYDSLLSGLGESTSSLENLFKERKAEEQRIRGFSSGLLGGLSPLSSTARGLTIADISRIGDLEGQLSGLNAQRQGFSSDILGQVMPKGFSDFDAQYGTLTGTLSDLRSNRAAEEKRIKDYEASLFSQADALTGRLGGMTIADLDGLNSVRDELNAAMTGAGRFSSLLGFDLSQETGMAGLGGAQARLNKLLNERSAEEDRINTATRDFRNRARGLETLAGGLSQYNLDNLTGAQREIEDLRNEISGFSSKLPFDFSGTSMGDLGDAEAAITNLLGKRQTELEALRTRATDPLSTIGDIALSDETALNTRRSDINKLMSELSMYSGGTDDLKTLLSGGVTSVDSRLGELKTKRTELETQAKTLLDRVNNASYYASSGLTEDQAAIQQMRDQIELYNAQQAMDELSALEGRISGERSRLGADEGAAAERERAAQAAVLSSLGASGVPQFANYAAANPALQALYGRYFYNAPEEDRLLAPVNASAFSSALGLGR